MHAVTSFHATSVAPEQLRTVISAYLALDRARTYRRLFVARFSLLAFALGVIGFGFRWMPPLATWFSMALCAAAPAGAWVAELRCDLRLAKQLSALPDATTHVVTAPDIRKS